MGWEQLEAMLDENREEYEREQNTPPDACPFDGAILDVRSDGVRNCPMGNYRWEDYGLGPGNR